MNRHKQIPFFSVSILLFSHRLSVRFRRAPHRLRVFDEVVEPHVLYHVGIDVHSVYQFLLKLVPSGQDARLDIWRESRQLVILPYHMARFQILLDSTIG